MSRFSGNWTDSWPTLRKIFQKSQNLNFNNFKNTKLFFDFSTALVFLHQAAHFKTIGTFLSPKLQILENDRIFLGLRKIFKESENQKLNNFKSTWLFFDFSTAVVFLHQAAHFKTIGTFLSPKLQNLENDRIFLGLRKIFILGLRKIFNFFSVFCL
jgi:hypothetical protein